MRPESGVTGLLNPKDLDLAIHDIFVPHHRLGAAVLRRKGEIVSLLPFSRSNRQIGPMRFVQQGSAASYHGRPTRILGERGLDQAKELFRCLLATEGWDLLEFRGVDSEGTLADVAAAAGCVVSEDVPSYAIPLAGAPNLMSSKHRRNLRRVFRRLQERESTKVLILGPTHPGWGEALRAFSELHTARWQGTDSPSPLRESKTRERFVTRLSGPEAPTELTGVGLEVSGVIKAVILGLDDGEVIDAWRLAYDESLSPISPGIQLVQLLAEHAASSGRKMLRLGRGDDAYKQGWKTIPVPQVSIRAIRPGPKIMAATLIGKMVGRKPFAGWTS